MARISASLAASAPALDGCGERNVEFFDREPVGAIVAEFEALHIEVRGFLAQRFHVPGGIAGDGGRHFARG